MFFPALLVWRASCLPKSKACRNTMWICFYLKLLHSIDYWQLHLNNIHGLDCFPPESMFGNASRSIRGAVSPESEKWDKTGASAGVRARQIPFQTLGSERRRVLSIYICRIRHDVFRLALLPRCAVRCSNTLPPLLYLWRDKHFHAQPWQWF